MARARQLSESNPKVSRQHFGNGLKSNHLPILFFASPIILAGFFSCATPNVAPRAEAIIEYVDRAVEVTKEVEVEVERIIRIAEPALLSDDIDETKSALRSALASARLIGDKNNELNDLLNTATVELNILKTELTTLRQTIANLERERERLIKELNKANNLFNSLKRIAIVISVVIILLVILAIIIKIFIKNGR